MSLKVLIYNMLLGYCTLMLGIVCKMHTLHLNSQDQNYFFSKCLYSYCSFFYNGPHSDIMLASYLNVKGRSNVLPIDNSYNSYNLPYVYMENVRITMLVSEASQPPLLTKQDVQLNAHK